MSKFMKSTLVIAMCASTVLGVAARAAESSLDAAYFSSYVWRGQVINDESVLQPAFTTTTDFGLSLNAWCNMDLTDKFDNRGKFTEVDLTASYALPLKGPVGVEVGVIEYIFPKQAASETAEVSDTGEVYGKVNFDVLLSPTLAVYYDFDEAEGFYETVGISHSFELIEKLSLDLGASMGAGSDNYNEYYFGEDSAAFNDVNGSAGLTYAFTDSFSVSGLTQYTYLIDSKIRDAAKDSEAYNYCGDRFFAGLSASYGF